ncbi:MAG: hypothetical protein L6R28_12960 [Planctomycetes bacterium]|nr:hypothetical protein [Planctomycetota bacterium]
MIWSQRIDPKAGEWKHEILVRGALWILASVFAFLFCGFVYAPKLYHNSTLLLGVDVATLILHGYVGLVAGLAETALRRTWRRTALNCGLCMSAILLGFVLSEKLGPSSDDYFWVPFSILGGAAGICAGLGSRNFLATILGFVAGQTAVWATFQFYSIDTLLALQFSYAISMFLLFALLLIPPVVLSGVGVWAGCKFSKPIAAESPQPPAPGGL